MNSLLRSSIAVAGVAACTVWVGRGDSLFRVGRVEGV